jgi:hypothetical protein
MLARLSRVDLYCIALRIKFDRVCVMRLRVPREANDQA